jgi:hypothetical protein
MNDIEKAKQIESDNTLDHTDEGISYTIFSYTISDEALEAAADWANTCKGNSYCVTCGDDILFP